MAITSFSGCKVDRAEYGRYARQTSQGDLGRIVVTGTGIEGLPGDVVVYSLVNSVSGRVVARKTQPYDSMMSDENSVTFDLETDCLDEFGLFRAIRGEYHARVAELTDPPYTDPEVYADSPTFRIRIVTAAELRDKFLFGVRLDDYTRLVGDSTGIAGVTVTGSTGVQEGGYPLRYKVGPQTLEFGSDLGGIPSYGPPVAVGEARIGDEIALWADAIDQYVFVSVDATRLPDHDIDGGIGGGLVLLRPAKIDDATIGRHLDSASETWQTVASLAVPLEPWTVGTTLAAANIAAKEARDPTRAKLPFDRVGVSAEPWRDAKAWTRGPHIELPGRRLLVLHFLGGFYNTSMVLDLETQDWWVMDEYNGNVDMVPNFAARLPAGPVLSPFVYPGLRGGFLGDYVPNFWQYAFTHGLKDLRHGAGEVIREAIMREALLPIYMLGGRAAQSVYASESFNRDGVGLSRQYSAGQMGVYSSEIAMHDAWVKRTSNMVRKQLSGIIVQG